MRTEIPGLELADAHTHIGSNDPDGYRCSREELTNVLEVAGARAAVFPMHEPDGYPPANDMVLEQASASDGRLVAFCRLDPEDESLAEARRQFVGRLVETLYSSRSVARRGHAFAADSKRSNVCSDRRNRGRPNDFVAGGNRRRAQLGLSFLLAARRHLHSLLAPRGRLS